MCRDSRLRRAVAMALVLAGPAAAGAESCPDVSWVQKMPATSPPASEEGKLVYDSQRGVAVYFNGDYVETWEYDGTTWTNRAPDASPPRVIEFGMAYDAAHRYTVLFGGSLQGQDGLGHSDQTWLWNGSAWREFGAGPFHPQAREQHAMTFDSRRGVIVLYGGFDVGPTFFHDTWEFDFNLWTKRADTGPPPLSGASMAYDAARGVSVLFGGYDGTGGGQSTDTWEWDGQSWTRRATTGPPGRTYATIAYDAARGVSTLFGGEQGDPRVFLGDTWDWDGTVWTPRGTEGPAPREGPTTAYDSTRGVMVLFGGLIGTSDGPVNNAETWELQRSVPAIAVPPHDRAVNLCQPATFSVVATGRQPLGYQWRKDGADLTGATTPNLVIAAASPSDAGSYDVVAKNLCGSTPSQAATLFVGPFQPWTRASTTPPSPAQISNFMVYDPAHGPTIFDYRAVGYAWDGSRWTARFAGGSHDFVGAGFAFDTDRHVVVSFGGTTPANTGPTDDTWEWDADTAVWSKRSPAHRPPAVGYPAMAYDPVRKVTVLVGGNAGRPVGGTWEWNGADWTEREPNAFGYGMVWDSDRQVLELTDGGGIYEWSGNAWVPRGTNGPTPRFYPGLAYDAATHRTLFFGGYTYIDAGRDVQFYDDLWAWDGTSWTQLVLPTPLPPGQPVGMAYDAARGVVVLFGISRYHSDQDLLDLDSTFEIQFGTAQFTQQPRNHQVCAGQRATLSALAASRGTVAYRWRKDGQPLTDGGRISGATSPTLAIDPVTAADAGTYDVVATACGSDTASDAVTLTIGQCRPGTTCGDGVVDPGEQCDDGNLLAGDCCSPTCTAEPTGSPCPDDGDPCTANQCDGAGHCAASQIGLCTSDVIGGSGGTFSSLDGLVSVSVPPGAVGQPTRFVVTESSVSRFGVGTPGSRVLSAELQPEGVTFDPPVLVTFRWPDANNDGVVDGTTLGEGQLKVYRNGKPFTQACVTPAYQPGVCSNVCCDRVQNSFELQLTSFSEYVVLDDQLTTATTTTTSVAPTTTTVVASACDNEPAAPTFASIDCRLVALLARVTAEPGLGVFRAKLVQNLSKARDAEEGGDSACTASDLKRTRQRLKQTIRDLIEYAHHLKTLRARKKLPGTLRADLLAEGNPIMSDVKSLKRAVRCPADGGGS
jgi:cysteine-rich repeat protein